MRISDWSSDVCSSDLDEAVRRAPGVVGRMILARDLAPVGRRRIIDARIALRFERDFGQLDAVEPKRSEEHTSELQSLMRISYAVFCLKKTTQKRISNINNQSCAYRN